MVSRLSIAYRLYKWIFVILEKLLFSRYVYISCLDHPVFSLLATGYPGPGTVPGILAAHTPVPDFGHCGRWGVCPVKRDNNIARQNAAAALSAFYYPAGCFTKQSLLISGIVRYKNFAQYFPVEKTPGSAGLFVAELIRSGLPFHSFYLCFNKLNR
jgi:hypothetical protein